jgi:hypothetical protein
VTNNSEKTATFNFAKSATNNSETHRHPWDLRRILKTQTWLLILIVLFVCASIPAQSADEQDESLRSIPAFCILVEKMPPSPLLESAGISEVQLRTDIELRCRSFGLNVKPETALLPCYLYVNVSSIPENELTTIYSVKFDFEQPVIFTQSQRAGTSSTWSRSTTGFVGVGRVKDIHDAVMSLADQFINAYLAKNEKSNNSSVNRNR